jgi:hypothetical protein
VTAKSTGDESPNVHNDLSGEFHGTAVAAGSIGRVDIGVPRRRLAVVVAVVIAGAALVVAVAATFVALEARDALAAAPQVTVVTVGPGAPAPLSSSAASPTTPLAPPVTSAASGVPVALVPPAGTTSRTTAATGTPTSTSTSTTTSAPSPTTTTTAPSQCSPPQSGNGVFFPSRVC